MAGTWANTGSLATKTDQTSAVLLSGGKVLKVGGNAPTSAQCQLLSAGSWVTTGSIAVAKTMVILVKLQNNTILAFGGLTDPGANTVSATAEIYDPATELWTATGSLNEARALSAFWLLNNGQVLVAGGMNFSAGNLSQTSALYDPNLGTSAFTGSLSEVKGSAGYVIVSGIPYIIGGANLTTARKAVEKYSVAGGTWSALADMPFNMSNDGVNNCIDLLNGTILTIGGRNHPFTSAGGDLATCALYNIAGNTWSTTGALHVSRLENMVWHLTDARAFTAGGFNTNDTVFLKSCESYDPATAIWYTEGDLTVGTAISQMNANVTLANGKPLLIGGFTATTPDSDVVCEVFTQGTFPPPTTFNLLQHVLVSSGLHAAVISATQAGSLIVVSGVNITGCSDNVNGNYTLVAGTNAADAAIWYFQNSAAGATNITCTGNYNISVSEWSGAKTTGNIID